MTDAKAREMVDLMERHRAAVAVRETSEALLTDAYNQMRIVDLGVALARWALVTIPAK